jgi:hypothetical protein
MMTRVLVWKGAQYSVNAVEILVVGYVAIAALVTDLLAYGKHLTNFMLGNRLLTV